MTVVVPTTPALVVIVAKALLETGRAETRRKSVEKSVRMSMRGNLAEVFLAMTLGARAEMVVVREQDALEGG